MLVYNIQIIKTRTGLRIGLRCRNLNPIAPTKMFTRKTVLSCKAQSVECSCRAMLVASSNSCIKQATDKSSAICVLYIILNFSLAFVDVGEVLS